jgi:hypothetical protein
VSLFAATIEKKLTASAVRTAEAEIVKPTVMPDGDVVDFSIQRLIALLARRRRTRENYI